MYLWQIGGLFRHDMQPPPPEEQEEAERLLQSRIDRVKEVERRRKD